jgi:predicted Fe-Mo cluster-binding NifX family protein
MKVAIASDDGQQIAQHTGRCGGFAIYDIDANRASFIEFRDNTFTAHAHGECQDDHHGNHVAQTHHGHADLVQAIADCGALITRGLGPRLLADLAAAGIQVFVTDAERVADAAQAQAVGALIVATRSACRCH